MTIFKFAARARRAASRAFFGAGLAALLAAAPSVASAQDLKIGVVDFRRVVEESPQAIALQEKLKTEFAPREAELVKTQDDYNKRAEEYQRNSAVMGAEERETLERELRDQQRNFERSRDLFIEDLDMRRNEELQVLQTTLVTFLRTWAETEDYDLLLADAVYVGEAADVTDEVLAALKKNP